eukprot:SAG31_NODE_7026_length_1813_cov_2.015169_1_plen_82_part_00
MDPSLSQKFWVPGRAVRGVTFSFLWDFSCWISPYFLAFMGLHRESVALQGSWLAVEKLRSGVTAEYVGGEGLVTCLRDDTG